MPGPDGTAWCQCAGIRPHQVKAYFAFRVPCGGGAWGQRALPFLQDPLRLFEDISQHWVFDAEAIRKRAQAYLEPGLVAKVGAEERHGLRYRQCAANAKKNRPLPSAHRPEGQYS